MTRPQKLRAGKLWQITPTTEPETILYEGSKTACLAWLRAKGVLRHWKKGKSGLSLGRVIWEKEI